VLALLDDIEPMRVGVNATPQMDEWLRQRARQWAEELPLPLLGVVASSPSPDVRQAASAAVVAVGNAVRSAQFLSRDMLTHRGPRDQLEVARSDYSEARSATARLAQLLRGEGADT
jgi:hypothetical protein